MSAPAPTTCRPTIVRYPLEGVHRNESMGGCGQVLVYRAYTNRKLEHVSLVICPHCDGYSLWPGRRTRR